MTTSPWPLRLSIEPEPEPEAPAPRQPSPSEIYLGRIDRVKTREQEHHAPVDK